VFVAAFVAVDPPEEIQRARQLLNEAKADASDAAEAVLEQVK
jgi:hypothetical protein